MEDDLPSVPSDYSPAQSGTFHVRTSAWISGAVLGAFLGSFALLHMLLPRHPNMSSWVLHLQAIGGPTHNALLACACVHTTMLALVLMQVAIDLFTQRSPFFLLQASICFVATASFICTCSPFALIIHTSSGVPIPIARHLSWLYVTPSIAILLGTASLSSFKEIFLSSVAFQTVTILSLASSLLRDPFALVAAVLGTVIFISFVAIVATTFYKLVRALRATQDHVRVAMAVVTGVSCLALLTVLGGLTLLQRIGVVSEGIFEWYSMVADVFIKVPLSWALVTINIARLEHRQLKVMRAIENSCMYKAANQLEEVSLQKDRFMTAMTHELRTPLNAIIGLSEGLLSDACGSLTDSMRRQVRVVHVSALRLSSMIADVMDSTALRMDKLVLEEDVVGLYDIVSDVIDLTRAQVATGVALTNTVPRDCTVMGDSNRIVQILNNLLSNAAKFTHTGEVVVSAVLQGHMWCITVSDTGIGIPEDKQEAIFDAFEQVDMSISRSYGGFGLGLNIVRDLVRVHGGTITVESSVDLGSSFTFTLRSSKVPADAEGATLPDPPPISAARPPKSSKQPQVPQAPSSRKLSKNQALTPTPLGAAAAYGAAPTSPTPAAPSRSSNPDASIVTAPNASQPPPQPACSSMSMDLSASTLPHRSANSALSLGSVNPTSHSQLRNASCSNMDTSGPRAADMHSELSVAQRFRGCVGNAVSASNSVDDVHPLLMGAAADLQQLQSGMLRNRRSRGMERLPAAEE